MRSKITGAFMAQFQIVKFLKLAVKLQFFTDSSIKYHQ
jgi:hypothetical protein